MRLTVDLVRWADVYINALRQHEVNLRSYQIPVIENLAILEDQYDCIDLSDNSIEIIENFTPMIRLKSLLFHNNKIRKIVKGLGKYLPNLEDLMLSNNHIQTLADLEGIAEFKNLIRVNLLGNPVVKERNYRLWMIAHLPQLRMLDFQKVKTSERKEAYAMYPKEREKLRKKRQRKNKRRKQQQNQNKKSNQNKDKNENTNTSTDTNDDDDDEDNDDGDNNDDHNNNNTNTNTNTNKNKNKNTSSMRSKGNNNKAMEVDENIYMNTTTNTNTKGDGNEEEKKMNTKHNNMRDNNNNNNNNDNNNMDEVFTEEQRYILAEAIVNANTPEEAERLQGLLESGYFPKEGLDKFLKRQQ